MLTCYSISFSTQNFAPHIIAASGTITMLSFEFNEILACKCHSMREYIACFVYSNLIYLRAWFYHLGSFWHIFERTWNFISKISMKNKKSIFFSSCSRSVLYLLICLSAICKFRLSLSSSSITTLTPPGWLLEESEKRDRDI